jgi:hypothetical protein
MDRTTTIRMTTSLVGFSLLVPASIGLFATGSPTLVCPLPALTVIPLFYLSSRLTFRLVVLLPTVLFFAWNPGLFRADPEVPRRSYALFAGAIALSVAWFLMGWNYGLQYQGPRYTHAMCVANLIWITALGVMFLRRWKKESTYRASLAVHWVLFAWLGWYAFPYLGELP